jgi:hypothetical protein
MWDRNEALEIEEDVLKLAQDVLTPSELSLAEQLSKDLVGTEFEKERAIDKLRYLVGDRPKRPISYLYGEEFFRLPKVTRNSAIFLGSYIDRLVKALTVEKTGESKYRWTYFGRNLSVLNGKIGNDLWTKLSKFNRVFYRDAKHDWEQYKEREHRFTSKEVVYMTFVTMELAKQIKKISSIAKDISEDKFKGWYS